jgi:dihydrodipicolinate synthase/N-acetylneuraminate lyase
VSAAPYKALGVPVYASAVFNFIPKSAMVFYNALACDDQVTMRRLIDRFFLLIWRFATGAKATPSALSRLECD